MATRRPRVKPTAILKARRPQIAATQQTNTATIKFEDEPKLTDAGQRSGDNAAESLKNHIDTSTHTDNTNGNASNATESTATIATTSNTVNHTTNQSNTTDKLKEPGPNGPPLVINEPPLPPQSSPPLSTSTPVEAKPFRRLLTPAVNIPNRRRPTNANLTKLHLDIARPSQTASSPARSQEFAAIRSPSPTRADEKPAPGVKAEGQVSAASTASTTATFVKEFSVPSPSPLKDDLPQRRGTVDNEECFKSPPFMSPSMQYNRRQDPSSSPFTDCYGDDVKSPSSVSSNKIRPRIRPTPYFMVRRNSIQVRIESNSVACCFYFYWVMTLCMATHSPKLRHHIAKTQYNAFKCTKTLSLTLYQLTGSIRNGRRVNEEATSLQHQFNARRIHSNTFIISTAQQSHAQSQ